MYSDYIKRKAYHKAAKENRRDLHEWMSRRDAMNHPSGTPTVGKTDLRYFRLARW